MARAPPVASKTTWSSGPRLCPNTSRSSGVERTRGPDQHASPSTRATSQKSLWTSKPMNRTCLLLSSPRWRPGGANDNYGCVLVAQPDQSQGRPITTAGSRPIVSRRPARPGSPEAPRPGARTLREGPSSVQAASPTIFMQVQHRETAPRDRASPTGGLIYRRSGCADPQGVPVGVENADPSCGDLLVLVDEPTEQILPLDL